jgi:uncharacterized protein (TIGR02246 family)
MKNTLNMALVLGCVLSLGCNSAPVSDTRPADEAAIRAANVEWSKVTEAGDLDRIMTFYTDDAVALNPDGPMAFGRDAIRASYPPGFSANWQLTKVEVARSGEIAYTIGTSEVTMPGPSGTPITRKGKWLGIWKRQADGTWKCAVDIPNFNEPPVAAQALPLRN